MLLEVRIKLILKKKFHLEHIRISEWILFKNSRKPVTWISSSLFKGDSRYVSVSIKSLLPAAGSGNV